MKQRVAREDVCTSLTLWNLHGSWQIRIWSESITVRNTAMGAFKLLPWRTIFVSLSSSTCLKRMLFFFLVVNTLYRTVEVRSLALTRSLSFRSQCSHEKVCNLAIRLYPAHRIKKIICDGGAEFVNEEMNAWCRKLGIKFMPEPSHRAHLKLCEKTSDSGLLDEDDDGDRITAEIFLGKWARNRDLHSKLDLLSINQRYTTPFHT